MVSLAFLSIDPVIFHIYGPIAVRWYGMAYTLGIIISAWYIKYLNYKSSHLPLKGKVVEDMLSYAAAGIIIGGRLGYVLFYNISYYILHPIEIIKIWQGGMSFHGGLIGLVIGIYFLCKKYQLNFLALTDLIACAAPIGLFFGRIANFINGELIGRKTEMAWGIIFPNSDGKIRHPSQLYEAFLEGFMLFFIMFFLRKSTQVVKNRGILSALFLILYGVFRSIVEFFREPDYHIGFIAKYFTTGQILCIPFILVGVLLIYRLKERQTP
ncbi:MAG: prolipoprotein diacylglyceryl transferase [Candidatus Midichloria sp.]|nr:MAG: prolipoprotein diacylglyceryl transferase [Candidatus Midichloria sp.]